GSETKGDRPIARSVLSLPVELYLHGVTCPINREHYSPVDGLRIRFKLHHVTTEVTSARGSEANVDDGESKRRAAQLALQQSTYEVGTLPDYIDSFTLKIRAANCVYYKSGTSAQPYFLGDKNSISSTLQKYKFDKSKLFCDTLFIHQKIYVFFLY
ncbi:hypothetical protein ALC56_02649, partial [Trachymyrmex septentrionalis]